MSNFTGLAKIQKINNEEPDEFEKSISQALLDLEMNSDMKAHLRELHIKAAKEVDVGGKRAIVIFVPPPQLKSFQKVQTRLVRELEKKFAGKVQNYLFNQTITAKLINLMFFIHLHLIRLLICSMSFSLPKDEFWPSLPGRQTN